MELYSGRLGNVEYPIRAVEALSRRYACVHNKMEYLNIGDPVRLGFKTGGEVCRHAADAILKGGNGYAPSEGVAEARDAISSFYSRRGIRAPSQNIFITSGVSEALHFLYLSLFNEGDSILLPRPYYPLYQNLADLFSVKAEYYDLDEEGIPVMDKLKISQNTKAVVLTNPNNPFGSLMGERQVSEFRDAVFSSGAVLIADEIYSENVYGGKMSYSMKGCENGNIIVLGGISKACLVPGWRLGWAVFGNSPSLEHLKSNFVKLLQMRLSSPAPFQHALPRIIGDDSIYSGFNSQLAERAKAIEEKMGETSALSVNKISSAFYAFLKLNFDMKSAAFISTLIRKHGIVAVPGTGFGREGYIRIVFLEDKARLSAALDTIISEAEASL